MRSMLPVALGLALHACSLNQVAVLPPGYKPYKEPVCSTDRVPAVVDGTLATLMAGAAVVGGVSPRPDTVTPESNLVGIVGASALGALFAISSGVGFFRTDQCNAAYAQWEPERRRRSEEAERITRAFKSSQGEAERWANEMKQEKMLVALERATLRLENRYLESLFTVNFVLPETGEQLGGVIGQRVQANQTEVLANALVGRPGQGFAIDLESTSLGERHRFEIPLCQRSCRLG
jgi:hypothetical protein